MWIPYPARGESGVIGDWLPRYQHKDPQFYYVAPELLPIRGTEYPWLYTSGCQAETELCFRLIEPGGPPAAYTVRLHFAEPEELQPGERVFDVLLQGAVVLKDFDMVREAGGARQALVKTFPGVRVADELTVRLRASAATPARQPILCAIEVTRDETRTAPRRPDG